jgi:N-hydroxyarylamine O-acetyltransferase
VNLDAYLRRIQFSGDTTPSAETLAALHLAHATTIPFENLDILLGRPIRLDPASLEQKLVHARRGGYCFEQNLFFASVLETIGFRVTRLIGRVRYRTSAVLPRTHMMLLVDASGSQWIADVGFGGEGLLLPVPFGRSEESRQFLWTYRAVQQGDRVVMQTLRDGAWLDMYAFTLEPQELIDYEVANHYTSTHPSSRFVLSLTAQRPGREERLILRNLELTIDRGADVATRTLRDQGDVLDVLAASFGLELPADTSFPVLAGV